MTGYLKQTLKQLFDQIPVQALADVPDVHISGISIDSRTVKSGDLFVALEGGSVDGHQFIPAAIKNGAAAVMGMKPQPDGVTVPYIRVENTRPALAWVSAAFYRFPARHLTMIGVTGTDGKTTTSNLIYQVLLAAGIRVGIVSTVNAVIGDEILDTGFHVTTPEAPDVQRYLARMVAAGLTHVILETTSHGWAQDRVTACDFDYGVVTNITHEHLDFHGSYENYRAAKGRLFAGLHESHDKERLVSRAAILNADDSSYAYLDSITHVQKFAYSITSQAQVWADDIESTPSGTSFTAHTSQAAFLVKCKLVGDYNISNCLAAISLAVEAMGLPVEMVRQGIANLPGVPGRMEIIDKGQPFTAIVDFAHTPNALKRALETARTLTNGRVIAVFGSAGLRDRKKRRMMAEVSAELADISILTAEDPRTESLDDILAEMAQGAESRNAVEGKSYLRVPDRGDAIRTACKLAQPGDLVISCGKGHEQSMCFGTEEFPWDDRTAMKAVLSELMGVSGPKMPKLPTS